MRKYVSVLIGLWSYNFDSKNSQRQNILPYSFTHQPQAGAEEPTGLPARNWCADGVREAESRPGWGAEVVDFLLVAKDNVVRGFQYPTGFDTPSAARWNTEPVAIYVAILP